ncbi:E3 ubiquitin-protein ligase mib1-like [Amblyomma americanum]
MDLFRGFVCDSCRRNIVADRYKCAEYVNLNLCATCYENNMHEIQHEFRWFDKAGVYRGTLPPRAAAIRRA